MSFLKLVAAIVIATPLNTAPALAQESATLKKSRTAPASHSAIVNPPFPSLITTRSNRLLAIHTN